ncbi:SMI1/KNR4 family protein [Pseudoalteromonas sp. SR44-2]|uniref:SMI1/KNR4 family protein n=1 Tax=Pseudoalteromonas sp. SR44-2 TaxID=2760937 RepID=UPI001601EB52|nr:SMI1/KNR4 family protein [Pseudoalteromonas sp. SR44-2]MBB1338884.1 SMI1/KNR4 family protein [Pseudoalteromonas sp. SR44-2]
MVCLSIKTNKELVNLQARYESGECMDIKDVVLILRDKHEPTPKPLRLPTEQEVNLAEQDLSFKFPEQYRYFVLNASNVVFGIREPGLVLPDMLPYLNLRVIAIDGWEAGVPKDFLSFCTDNGNYFTISNGGDIGYFDHDDGCHSILGGEFKDWIIEDWLELEDHS